MYAEPTGQLLKKKGDTTFERCSPSCQKRRKGRGMIFIIEAFKEGRWKPFCFVTRREKGILNGINYVVIGSIFSSEKDAKKAIVTLQEGSDYNLRYKPYERVKK